MAAGGIADGAGVAAAVRREADGVRVGTRLVASVEAHAHPEYERRLAAAQGPTSVSTAFGREWPGERYRLLPKGAVREWEGREHEIPDPPPGPDVIGSTLLFPHSARIPYDMPKFSAIPPTPETTGDWEEMAFPAGQGGGLVRAVETASEIVTRMMADAHGLLSLQHTREAP